MGKDNSWKEENSVWAPLAGESWHAKRINYAPKINVRVRLERSTPGRTSGTEPCAHGPEGTGKGRRRGNFTALEPRHPPSSCPGRARVERSLFQERALVGNSSSGRSGPGQRHRSSRPRHPASPRARAAASPFPAPPEPSGHREPLDPPHPFAAGSGNPPHPSAPG